ncbi:MAG: phage protein Gp27 family protein [Rhodanobacter sp.]
MPRASTIKRLPAAQRSYLEKLIREDRHTLDEILAQVRAKFPAAVVPSRSAVGRYSQHVSELAGRMRDIQAAGTALVTELGEDPNDRAGQLLVQAVTTLATHAALKATDDEAEDLSIKEIGMLARAAHATMQTRKMSLAERQEIARLAREALQAEQSEALKDVVKAGGLTASAAETIRKQILGLS